jgi:hypothetical protein
MEVDEPTSEELVKLYPNPASSTITLSSGDQVVQASIYSLDGRLLIQQKTKHRLDISMLADGMYIIHVSDEAGETIKVDKLVKTSIN